MIIKKWSGSAFEPVYPKTINTMLYDATGTTQMFSGNKILPAYLPDSVFDSLYYFAAIATNQNLRTLAENAIIDATTRGAKGYYWVATATVTLTANATEAVVGAGTVYYITSFLAAEGGGTPTTVTLEAGDWLILDAIVSGDGVSGTPYVVRFVTVNNTYEDATTSAKGIVQLSDQTVYANLSGSDVVTEGVLKTVIDNASFSVSTHNHDSAYVAKNANITAGTYKSVTVDVKGLVTGGTNPTTLGGYGITDAASATHSHGNLDSSGNLSGTQITAASGDYIPLADASASNKLGYSNITLGVGTTTYLRNDGTWGTPAGTYAHPNHTGDVTSTGDGATAIASAAVTYAKIQNLSALSVFGRSANSVGVGGAISTSSDAQVLRTASGVLGFGTIGGSSIDAGAISFDKIVDSAAAGLSVIGRSAASAGDFAEIAAASDYHVLRRSGSTLGFGLITNDNITSATIANAKLANMAQNTIKGRITTGTGAPEDLTAANVRTITETWPMYCQTATPTTTVTNAVWFDIN